MAASILPVSHKNAERRVNNFLLADCVLDAFLGKAVLPPLAWPYAKLISASSLSCSFYSYLISVIAINDNFQSIFFFSILRTH